MIIFYTKFPMMKSKYLFVSVLLCHLTLFSFAQDIQVQKVHPTNWWVGMKNRNLQVLLYGKDLSSCTVRLDYPGVTLQNVQKVESPNYLFVNLFITNDAKPGTLNFELSREVVVVKKKKSQIVRLTKTVPYSLLARNDYARKQISSADLIYLIMPDRFANGDPSNDKFGSMLDSTCDAQNPYLRHGGDFAGIQKNLDYLQNLGVTALWMTPVIENDETLKKELHGNLQAGYHGYHFTDHYAIERRLGGEIGYKNLADALHQKGMKLIQDAVYNHVSDDHWLWKDQPSKDWFNHWPAYTNTSHKEAVLMDPNGSEADRKLLLDGWFTPFLPDVNQRNPHCATYLIQHALWCTEKFDLDGWRIDTYKYNDMDFMNRCNAALLEEYPNLLIFGESWINNPAQLSYLVKNRVAFPFKNNQPGTCDFPVQSAIITALNEPFGWDGGVNRLYQTLTQDFLYEDPSKMVTFLDNHDTDRYLSMIGEDLNKYKIGLTWLLTTRGIPQLYYGTEILMKNVKNPTDAEVRKNFPGGWNNDPQNKFSAQGRTKAEQEAFEFVSKLANYRKNTPALHSGKLTHFQPRDNVYVYFRHNSTKTIMVITNTDQTDKELDTTRFAELMAGFKSAKEVLSAQQISNLSSIKVPSMSSLVLELEK